MKRLLVDAGNSRIKWAVADAAGIGPQSSEAHDGDPDAVLRRILENAAPSPDEIVLVDVSTRIDTERLPVTSRRLTATASACGVVNGYRSPGQLGADRWAALLAARTILAGRAGCIVDCGTAITLDLLDAQGHHLGGVISPGLQLQRQALYRGTALLASQPGTETAADGDWGRDTATAIAAGARLAVAGCIGHGVAHARELLGADTVVVLTGGDAARVLDGIHPPLLEAPALVLEGADIWVRDACAH